MARNNVFLGTASGKIGDVVLMQREGTQVARKRVYNVANPKTLGQSTQRNYLAPVAKFYSPLATVLERSYEGLNKSKSYNAFLKKNIDLARAKGWFVPKGTPFFPLPYQISRGSIAPVVYSIATVSNKQGLYAQIGSVLDIGAVTIGNLSRQFLTLPQCKEGDQITVILVADNGAGEYFPVACRFLLNATSTELFSSISGSIVCRPSASEDEDDPFFYIEDFTTVAGAIIISRYEAGAWKRSTQVMTLSSDLMAAITSQEAYTAAISSYGSGSAIVQSNIYLNQGTDNQASNSFDNLVTFQMEQGLEVLGRLNGTVSTQGPNATFPTAVRTVSIQNAANGDRYDAIVINHIDGSANFGFVLGTDSESPWINRSSFESWPTAVTVYVTAANDAVATVLKANGTPNAVFQ